MRSLLHTVLVLAVLGALTPACAADAIGSNIPSAQKVGEGRLSVMVWDVYDAVLYAPGGHWKENQPFAIQLTYLRKLSGKKIADRSIEEIRDQGFSNEVKLADWYSQMRSIFPDVDKGVRLTGVFLDSGETMFFRGDQKIGSIQDPEFSRRFSNIWLSPETSAPDLRSKLLGGS